MLTAFDRRGMIAVFPKSPSPSFSLIVLLPTAPSHQLYRLRDHLASFHINNQKMNVIGGHHVIEHAQAKALTGFKEPADPGLPVTGKFQQKLPRMTAVRQMPDLSPQVIPMCPWPTDLASFTLRWLPEFDLVSLGVHDPAKLAVLRFLSFLQDVTSFSTERGQESM